MAAHLERLRDGRRNSLFFAPGDLFSGWEFDASSFADEPTIEALNAMGLDFASAGNHEFDKSATFLTSHMADGDAFPVVGPGRRLQGLHRTPLRGREVPLLQREPGVERRTAKPYCRRTTSSTWTPAAAAGWRSASSI